MPPNVPGVRINRIKTRSAPLSQPGTNAGVSLPNHRRQRVEATTLPPEYDVMSGRPCAEWRVGGAALHRDGCRCVLAFIGLILLLSLIVEGMPLRVVHLLLTFLPCPVGVCFLCLVRCRPIEFKSFK